MDEKELRAKFMKAALDEIHSAVFEWGISEDGGYRDAVNYIQGASAMVSALDQVLDDK